VAEGFQFNGVKYEMSSLMLAEARAIQKATNLTPLQWEKAINEGDAEAITALIWIARKRNGEKGLRFDDVDGDLATFLPYLDEPEEESEGDEGEGKATPLDHDPTSSGTPGAEG
jgi:hypothetical protein